MKGPGKGGLRQPESPTLCLGTGICTQTGPPSGHTSQTESKGKSGKRASGWSLLLSELRKSQYKKKALKIISNRKDFLKINMLNMKHLNMCLSFQHFNWETNDRTFAQKHF